MTYLIIQVNYGTPAIMPFNKESELKEYVKSQLNDKTAVAIHDNVYFVHKNED